MFNNYLKVAFRNIKKHKGYSLINVSGLAIGIACCILILLWVQNELSYDRFHENSDRIYRVTRLWRNEDGAVSLHLGHVAPPIGPLLKNDFPEILSAFRMIHIGRPLVSYDNHYFEENQFFFAEQDIVNVFSFQSVKGDLLPVFVGKRRDRFEIEHEGQRGPLVFDLIDVERLE